jgi:hypothetical protein
MFNLWSDSLVNSVPRSPTAESRAPAHLHFAGLSFTKYGRYAFDAMSMHPSRFSSSIFRNSAGAVSAWIDMNPFVRGVPSTLTAGSVGLAYPPPICGFEYSSTT